MKKPAFIVIDGRRYLWRDILELRRRQLEEAAKVQQLTLFKLRDDSRPASQRTAAGRYAEPTLLASLTEGTGDRGGP